MLCVTNNVGDVILIHKIIDFNEGILNNQILSMGLFGIFSTIVIYSSACELLTLVVFDNIQWEVVDYLLNK